MRHREIQKKGILGNPVVKMLIYVYLDMFYKQLGECPLGVKAEEFERQKQNKRQEGRNGAEMGWRDSREAEAMGPGWWWY